MLYELCGAMLEQYATTDRVLSLDAVRKLYPRLRDKLVVLFRLFGSANSSRWCRYVSRYERDINPTNPLGLAGAFAEAYSAVM